MLGLAEEPPAEKAHKAPDDDNHGHRYACDRAGREGALVCAGGHTGLALQLVAGATYRALEGVCTSSGVCALRAPWNARHSWS